MYVYIQELAVFLDTVMEMCVFSPNSNLKPRHLDCVTYTSKLLIPEEA